VGGVERSKTETTEGEPMTKIEWTDKSWNPVTGCTKCSPGCANCYAEANISRLQANPKGTGKVPERIQGNDAPGRIGKAFAVEKAQEDFPLLDGGFVSRGRAV